MTLTTIAVRPRVPVLGHSALFALATFFSAALVFSVEPMIAKLLLPSLGGSASVWNTSLAFFQVALLAGYGYAHGLQRLRNIRHQIALHVGALSLAALTLPLSISGRLGAPDPNAPIAWLLGELTMSVGPTFALLSATAPLMQRWLAAVVSRDGRPIDADVYPLYAASNLGSLVALLAYPLLAEPFVTLTTQRMAWSIGFGVFASLVLTVGVAIRFNSAMPVEQASHVPRPAWSDMVAWVLLAAAPSSLMIGVTSYLTTDIASFPFIWVIPLALYLLTFVIAFAKRPWLSENALSTAQCISVVLCLLAMPMLRAGLGTLLAVHLATFFLTALRCHRMAAERRPDIAHLTIFYLCLSLGGVLGGCFNAFVAPLVFNNVIEYPLVLLLACLAGTWRTASSAMPRRILMVSSAIALLPIVVMHVGADVPGVVPLCLALLIAAAGSALLLRGNALHFTLVIGLAWLSFTRLSASDDLLVERSFFGVTRISEVEDPALGPVRLMFHGTTIHGAQSLRSQTSCQPLTYYASATPLGQTVERLQQVKPQLNSAVVGLGTGALASYMRADDRLTFYEIDPLVVRHARDSGLFTYLTGCAKSPVAVELGDARLTLDALPESQLDLLVIDAFSSDAVPAHLLTSEALRMYLGKLRPDGVLLMNLTNRHLELRDIVIAGLRTAGAAALTQRSTADARSPLMAAATTAVVASRSNQTLAPFRADARWTERRSDTARPWTDDYSNLLDAVIAGLRR